MKRKVIQIANSTQLISLPRKWALQYGIKKGDELEVEEKGSTVLVSPPNSNNAFLKTEVDITGFGHMAKRVVAALYRAGYDEIAIGFSTQKELAYVQECLGRSCIGFEILEQSRNRIVIKRVSEELFHELEPMFRRGLLTLTTMLHEVPEIIKQEKNDAIHNMTAMDHNMNKFLDFCGRLASRKHSEHADIIYRTMIIFERFGDVVRDLCIDIINHDIAFNKEISNIYQTVIKIMALVQELLFKFKFERMREFYSLHDALKEQIASFSMEASKKEQLVCARFQSLFYLIHHLDEVLLENAFVTQQVLNRTKP